MTQQQRREPPRNKDEAGAFKALGRAVALIREKQGMDREELAAKAEMTPAELEKVEAGSLDEWWGGLRMIAEAAECLSPLWSASRKNLRLGIVANPSGSVGMGRSCPSPALGQVVRGLREDRGLGQKALARKAGITQTTVSFVERGIVNPQKGTVEKLGQG